MEMNNIIKESIKKEFDKIIGAYMKNNFCDFDESINDLESNWYELLLNDIKENFCSYLKDGIIVKLWKEFLNEIES